MGKGLSDGSPFLNDRILAFKSAPWGCAEEHSMFLPVMKLRNISSRFGVFWLDSEDEK